MVNANPKIKRKEVDLIKLGEDLLKFAQDNSPEKMELDIGELSWANLRRSSPSCF